MGAATKRTPLSFFALSSRPNKRKKETTPVLCGIENRMLTMSSKGSGKRGSPSEASFITSCAATPKTKITIYPEEKAVIQSPAAKKQRGIQKKSTYELVKEVISKPLTLLRNIYNSTPDKENTSEARIELKEARVEETEESYDLYCAEDFIKTVPLDVSSEEISEDTSFDASLPADEVEEEGTDEP